MEFLTIFGVLAPRRGLVLLGVLLALAIGLLAAGALPFGPSPKPSAAAGMAQARLIVDHRATVVANTAENAGTVGTQAALLADIMAGDEQRDAIARRAGIAPTELGMQRAQLGQIVALGQLPTRAARASASIARPYVVNVWAASPLPVLTVDVTGPTGAAAARVARATRATLQALVAARAPSARRALAIKPLGAVRQRDVPSSAPSKLIAPVAAIAFLIFWLFAIVIGVGLRRWWREVTAAGAPQSAA